MRLYEVEQTARRVILGTFEADSPEQALRLMYIRAGFWDGVHPHDCAGNELGGRNTIVVREVTADDEWWFVNENFLSERKW